MTENRGDPVAIYWNSVAEVAAQPEAIYTSPEEQQRRRAIELQRLRELADGYRKQYFPKLPAVTIEAVKMGGRTSASVDPLGGWGQGIAIKVKSTRIDPFRWEPTAERFQDSKTIVKIGKDKSLLIGFKLRECPAGETIRKLEAELLVLQQLLRAEQHRVIEKRDRGFSEAESDVQNWGGNGRWFAQNASTIWKRWCADHSVPFVPCRHSRANYEQDHPTVDRLENDVEDAILTHLRPSCSGWPYICLKQNREPIAEGACPKTVGTGDAATVVTPETWERWKVEQQQLTGAVVQMIGSDALLWGVAWPQGEQPVIDELEGDPIVAMPVIEKPKPTSVKVTIPFDAGGAAQALEHVLKTAEQEHAIKGLWTGTLQVLANHPDSPGATRVQTELDTAPSIEIESRDTTGEPTVEHWRPILEGIADLVPWVNSWSLSCGGSTALGLDNTLTRKTDRGYSTPYPPQGAPSIDIEWARANGQKSNQGKLGKVLISKTAMGPFSGDPGAPPEWTELTAAIANRANQLLTPIDAGEPEPEPEEPSSPTEINGIELGCNVRHRQHGDGRVTRLFASSFGSGNAGVIFKGGDQKIVSIDSLTRFEPGEQIEPEPEPASSQVECGFKIGDRVRHALHQECTVSDLSDIGDGQIQVTRDLDGKRREVMPSELTPIEPGEPSQSELRKRPATGQRNRLTRAETTELHQRLRIALTTHQGNNRELAVQLAPELGLNVQMLTNHISKVRKQAA